MRGLMRGALHIAYFTAGLVSQEVIQRNSTYQLGTVVSESLTGLLPRVKSPRSLHVTPFCGGIGQSLRNFTHRSGLHF
jgi:hypothetical protein